MGKLIVRLVIGLLFAAFGLIGYCGNVVENPITGEQQRVQLTPEEEIILGQQSRDQLINEFGGLYPDPALQEYVDEVGQQVVQSSIASQAPYPFEFHLLGDGEVINAFALPGGQIFLTTALLEQMDNEAQLAAVLGHEVGHVVARHGAEHLAKQQLGAFLVNAIGIAASDRPDQGRQAAILAQAVQQLISLQYSRGDELESDRLGLQFITSAGYDPTGLLELMAILSEAAEGAQPPEFLSTHPHPRSRIEQLETLIAEEYPNGVPPQLTDGEQEFAEIVPSRL
ncbi:MAG: M48 family metallopeptidase [Synechococcales bacterium]|nr:M48 family metallopeptidase [Synechococcales bacterium]